MKVSLRKSSQSSRFFLRVAVHIHSLLSRWKNTWQLTKVKPSEAGLWAVGWICCLESEKGKVCQKRSQIPQEGANASSRVRFDETSVSLKHIYLWKAIYPWKANPFFSARGSHLPEYSKQGQNPHTPRFLTFWGSFRPEVGKRRATSQEKPTTMFLYSLWAETDFCIFKW